MSAPMSTMRKIARAIARATDPMGAEMSDEIGRLRAENDRLKAQAARDATIVALVVAEARAAIECDAIRDAAPPGKAAWQFSDEAYNAAHSRWLDANTAHWAAVRARIEQEDQA